MGKLSKAVGFDIKLAEPGQYTLTVTATSNAKEYTATIDVTVK